MKRPEMILFDYGHTLLYEPDWNGERGDRELLSSRLVALAMADVRCRLALEGPLNYKIARSWIRYTQPGEDILRANAVCEIYTNTAVPWEELRQGG